MNRCASLFTAFCLCTVVAFAQLPNQLLSDKISLSELDSARFGFSISNTNYMRNTEYFNPIEEGRTLFGYQLHPKLSYQPTKNIKLETGIWLRHDFGGANGFTEAIPTFSLKAKGKNNELIFGTLEGALSHGILEPMMDINSAIYKRIENGFQYKFHSKISWLDTWINWEKFIEPKEFAKEKFTAGIHYRGRINLSESTKITSYFQFMASHQGGQIDTDTINPFLMQFNAALGLKFQHNLSEKNSIYLDMAYLGYNETSDSKIYPKNAGNGVMGNLGLKLDQTDLMISYWQGSNFIAPRGTSIYQSSSTIGPKNYEENRQLVFVRFIQNKALFHSPVMASIRFEPVIDLKNGIFDFSYSLYLVYKGDWKFGK